MSFALIWMEYAPGLMLNSSVGHKLNTFVRLTLNSSGSPILNKILILLKSKS